MKMKKKFIMKNDTYHIFHNERYLFLGHLNGICKHLNFNKLNVKKKKKGQDKKIVSLPQ